MKAYAITYPDREDNGILFNSPHSGTFLPGRFLKQISIDPSRLLYSGDIMVDRLVRNVPLFGACVFINHFARIYVDTNRSAREIDPDMFQNPAQDIDFEKTGKVTRGFGIFSSKSCNGQEIYQEKLPTDEINHRLDQVYHPVHGALGNLLDRFHQKHGFYILIDCHSMPSYEFIRSGLSNIQQPDLVIGNCFGNSCSKKVTYHIANYFINHGLKVAYNAPYAGGYNTREYGKPEDNRHALQLEFNRALYMDEKTLEPNEGFASLQMLLTGLGENLDNNLLQFFPAQKGL